MSERELFIAALQIDNESERSAFLDQSCAGNHELKQRIEALLRAHFETDGRLERPLVAPETIESEGPATEATGIHTPTPDGDPNPGTVTVELLADAKPNVLIAGRYTLQEKIGEGGMGEVWVAKQSEPVKRRVALKLIKQGMDSRAVLQRFEQERQALAMMDHPNIAKVLDAGLTPNGQPFFVMELVNGLPLNRFCDELRLTPKDRLELFVPICQAVQHAHQKGIVHRDLKPANILITTVDAKPVPKVIDFGVAKATSGKLTDESMNTQFGAVVGTLEYMSPEQAGFSSEDVDTRADIYSLGVILYELLTGLRPIDAARLKKAALTEMIRIIQEEEPSKPSTRLSTDASLPSLAAMRQTDPRKLMTMLRGELDWVVMKCLEKHREQRYETANALARDIQRYLADEAVEARPPSAGYRFQKFVRRNKGQVIAASLVLLTLIGGIIGTSIGLVRADRARQAEAAQRRIAVEEKKKAEASETLAKEQRTRAESREQQAIDAVKKFRDAVANNPELKNNPALESLRKTLLKEPLEFFRSLRDRLQADKDTRPESLDRLAHAAFELGVLSDEIGDKTDAMRAHEESLEIMERLARENPGVHHFAYDLAHSHRNVGSLQRKTGQPQRALESFAKALAIGERLGGDNPATDIFANFVAASHHDIGLTQKETGRPDRAFESYTKALAIQERLARQNPDVIKFASALAYIHNSIGVLQSETGQPERALESYGKVLAIRERLARESPNVALFASDLAKSHNNIGVLQTEAGQPKRALESFGKALEIRERLVRENPTVTVFACDLAYSHNNVGSLQTDTERRLESYGKALAIFERLAGENPAVTEFANEFAKIEYNIGILQAQMGQPERALESYGKALEIQERLARQNSAVIEFASKVGATLNNVATIELEQRRFSVAKQRLLDAIVWQKQALAANSRNPTYRQYLQNHYTNLQSVARGLGDDALAQEAQHGLDELAATDPRLLNLDARLDAVRKGEGAKDNPEQLELAERAYDTKRYALAARLWFEALEKDPKLADDRQTQYRYNAACAASLAGCGQGNDDPSPDESAKMKLRQQALNWLKAELAVWTKFVESGPPQAKAFIVQTLDHWKKDTDLAGIRDGKELAKLPEAERKEWQTLWAEVDALLKRTQG